MKKPAEEPHDAKERVVRENGEPKVNLDTILIEEIGEFGRYQKQAFGLALIIALLGGYSGNDYVFTTARISTRCVIPECESSGIPSENWLSIAIPIDAGSYDNCNRFNSSWVQVNQVGNGSCSIDNFDRDVIVPCEGYVYEKTDTIVYEFDLACQEWRRSVIGSASTFGIALPLTGMIADRYGRRFALALNAFNHGWLGLSRYWAQSYGTFITLEFLAAVFGAAGFACAYIIVMEFVGPRYRVLAGATTSTFYTIGLIMQALTAWAIPYWRHLILTLYIPQLFTIVYFFIMPESVRWYLSKGRYTEAEAQLKKAAQTNRKTMSEKSLQILRESSEEEGRNKELKKEKKEPWLVTLVFQHKPILLRCIIAPVWWITTLLVYYGLSMNAVNMSGNKYLNYIAVGAVEIPGFWTAVLLFDRIGRKPLFFCAFWICAACQFGFIFMPDGYYELSLAVYLVGKYTISIVVTSLYVFTNELFPTQYRTRLFAFSSMVGRIGSISAPLTPALGSMVWEHLPFVLFGTLAMVSGLLVLLAPETKGSRLPDTMKQASELGSKHSEPTL